MVSRKLFQFSLAPEPVDAPLAEVPALEDDPAELSHRLRSGRPSLGSLLVGSGRVTEEQVKDALAEGIRTGERLGEVLVRRRVVTDEVIAELLASQWQVPFVKTAALSVDPTAIRQFPHRVARELDAVPIGFEADGVVLVAIAEPSEDTFRRLRERLPDSSCVVIARSALDSLLESRLYAGRPDESEYSLEREPEPQLQPQPQPEPVAVEAPAAAPFAWGSVTDIEPGVPLLASFDDRDAAEAPPLPDEPGPEPEYEAEVEVEPESQPEVDPDPESEPEVEPGPEVEPVVEPEPERKSSFESDSVVDGLEPSISLGEDLDVLRVALPAPDQLATTAELSPVLHAGEGLPSDVDAAMAAITATSADLENIRSNMAAVGRALELVQRQLAERDSQLAERDAQLAESEAQLEAAERTISEERENGRQLRAELDSNSSLFAVVRQEVAGLSERLESIAPPGAEPTEQ